MRRYRRSVACEPKVAPPLSFEVASFRCSEVRTYSPGAMMKMGPPAASDTKHSGIRAPVRRREDLRLVRGAGRYTADENLPGQVYAVMVRSPMGTR
jgi:hypothetical protein